MKKSLLLAGVLGSVLMGAVSCQAANWVKNEMDVPNKNLASNYYDGDSVKAKDKTISWTEKFLLTPFGAKNYTKHLSTYPACKKAIDGKGEVTYHQMDFEIKDGKYRVVAKRNYNKKDELICSDKEMGNELDSSWHPFKARTPMGERYYLLVTKYKLGNL